MRIIPPNAFKIEIDKDFTTGYSARLKKQIEDIISWNIPHLAKWYPIPGRTIIITDADSGDSIKIKGAGFYNPSNVSFSGLKRTLTVVPESDLPMPPLQVAFKRDIVHIDPCNLSPYQMQSIHSHNAPVGGMLHEGAINDQAIFAGLQNSNLPSNKPLATYKYLDLFLNGEQMGVSVAALPKGALNITPYDICIAWYNPNNFNERSLNFLKSYCTNGGFDLNKPGDRLNVIAGLAKKAGGLILDFSLSAELYRFSGSPDNWNIKDDTNEPLYFSDVDTCKKLHEINDEQQVWEVLRNLITAIHQWIYYFIPSLSYYESGYDLADLKKNDFVINLIRGFFHASDENEIEEASLKIWNFLQPVFDDVKKGANIPLRSGEHFLQNYYPRPAFYLLVLNALKKLISESALKNKFTKTDISVSGIESYIECSAADFSHSLYYANYCPKEVYKNINLEFRSV
ncbi:MAG: hypothetical protein ABIP28_09040 [Mucilaginibacter sp.]